MVSIPIAWLLADVSLTVTTCGFVEKLLGIAPSILHITMRGGTEEPWDFCLHVGVYQLQYESHREPSP